MVRAIMAAAMVTMAVVNRYMVIPYRSERCGSSAAPAMLADSFSHLAR